MYHERLSISFAVKLPVKKKENVPINAASSFSSATIPANQSLIR